MANRTSRHSLDGYVLVRDGTGKASYLFPAGSSIPGQGFLGLTEAELGFRVEAGDKLVLFTPGRGSVADAVVVKKTLRGRFPDATGEWRFPAEPTPGLVNSFAFDSNIVINELMYHSRGEAAAAESWIELFNRGTNTADLADWRLDGGISFRFAPGTAILAGGYLVVAKNVEILRALHPGTAVVGPFTNSLSRHSDLVLLKDANGNPADEVRYFDGGRWPALTDGGGLKPRTARPLGQQLGAEAKGEPRVRCGRLEQLHLSGGGGGGTRTDALEGICAGVARRRRMLDR